MPDSKAIGIDLGTTFCCIGIWHNGQVEIIVNEQGNRTTASYVTFIEDAYLVGDAAKCQILNDPTNTIFDAKRLIGRNLDDPDIQSNMKYWPYKVVNINNMPYFEVKYQNETKNFSPEQISAMILSKLQHYAQSFVGQEITKAVITVPAYFDDAQRQATKDAAQMAGLNVLRIINEPTAAALAYGLNTKYNKELIVLIFDCGGGTTDITLLTMYDGVFEVKATHGCSSLGGQDFDNRLISYCLEDFKKKTKQDISAQNIIKNTKSAKALQRLRIACESAKRVLSISNQTKIEIDSLFDDHDYVVNISRPKFEDLCIDLFRRTIDLIDKVLYDANIDKSNVNEIVLVGGSTRIPKIKQMLSEYFVGKKINDSINPDEAVAYGAAIQAAILNGEVNEKLNEILLVDVTPLSLGLETGDGIMAKLIERNTKIPCKKSRQFSTQYDNQTAVTIKIFSGEKEMTIDNNELGTFRLEGIPPAPCGIPKINVEFSIDINGILNVTATIKSINKTHTLTINKIRFKE